MNDSSERKPVVACAGVKEEGTLRAAEGHWEFRFYDDPDEARQGEPDILVVQSTEDVDPTDDVVTVLLVEGDARDGFEALRLCGADLFVPLPLEPERLARLIRQELDARPVPRRAVNPTPMPSIVGKSPLIRRLLEDISQAARSSAPVLISGESGTGKEIAARALHVLSLRRDAPLVAVNCGAIPVELIESELFGHEKGAFTGADSRHLGRFEVADGGTLFLDEIGELPSSAQVKLLRVLQHGRLTRVGGTDRVDVDVRIVAATNRLLATEVEEGRFREDLFYRLNVLSIDVPTLRERTSDVRLLWDHFLTKAAEAEGTRPVETAEEVFRVLEHYSWPGNVRELRNIARRVVAMRPSRTVTPLALPAALRGEPSSDQLRVPGMTLEELERHAILKTYAATGSVPETAEILGVSERKIFYRLKQYREAAARRSDDGRPLVALVEDDPDLRTALRDLMSRSYHVDAYSSATELIECFAETHPDVVVTDLRLPKIDGIELTRRIREVSDAPVILMSAFVTDEKRAEAEEAGAAAFLPKPVDTIMLGRVLERVSQPNGQSEDD